MSDETNANTIRLMPEGYVEADLVGEQTPETFRKVYEDAQPFIAKLKAEGRPLLGLIEMSRQTGYSISSDKAALQMLETLEYDKLALCNAPHADVTKGIILALDRNDKTRFFDIREEAVAWLLLT